jgi:hypothetical protein
MAGRIIITECDEPSEGYYSLGIIVRRNWITTEYMIGQTEVEHMWQQIKQAASPLQPCHRFHRLQYLLLTKCTPATATVTRSTELAGSIPERR